MADTTLGFTVTMCWCSRCLPDGLDGLDPMTTREADGEFCETCGAALHGEDPK